MEAPGEAAPPRALDRGALAVSATAASFGASARRPVARAPRALAVHMNGGTLPGVVSCPERGYALAEITRVNALRLAPDVAGPPA